MEFSSNIQEELSQIAEIISDDSNAEVVFDQVLQSFLKTWSEKKKEVNIIVKPTIQKLMEDLKVEEQYDQDILMQMKGLGPVRGNKSEYFQQKIVDVGWIEKKQNGALFYKDAWGNDQEVPDKHAFLNEFFPAWVEEVGGVDLLNTKKDQGFTHLNILCTGVELARLGERNESMISIAHNTRKLYLPGKTLITSTADRGAQIPFIDELNREKICYFSDGYTVDDQNNESGKGLLNADLRGDLLFHPKQFDKSAHGGVTFEEYVKKTGAFQCSLTIPEGNLKKASDTSLAARWGRKRHKTNKTSHAYLADTTWEGQYAGESWNTLHEMLAFCASIVSRYGIVLDNDTVTKTLGSYLKNKGGVPNVCWAKGSRQLKVDRGSPYASHEYYGARSSVKKV